MKLQDCSNCQIGPRGGARDIGRPDIVCAINKIAQGIGIWDLSHGKRFYCSVYHRYGTPYKEGENWSEADQKEYEAVIQMSKALEGKR